MRRVLPKMNRRGAGGHRSKEVGSPRPSRLKRLRAWWASRPLAVTFAVYLACYLVVATALTMVVISAFDRSDFIQYYEVEFEDQGGRVTHAAVDSGPYIYDEGLNQLVPATEIDVPGDNPYAVFVSVDEQSVPAYTQDGSSDRYREVYATLEMLESGQIELYDWGLNYNDQYPQEDVLSDYDDITAQVLPEYDRVNRAGRVDSVAMFEAATGIDFAQAFGAGKTSNVAYYADAIRVAEPGYTILNLLIGASPFVIYGGLAIIMFRRFYRVHIAEPLDDLSGAARRIAAQDLDFCIQPVQGKELGALSVTLEDMRASLLAAQRELWRTAEERRRLNAAFAHDLRTPVTVLKGTVEMARLREAKGEHMDEERLETLAGQVGRLESYANAMSGLSKLEDRDVVRTSIGAEELADELFEHAADIVSARGEGLELACKRGLLEGDACVDVALVEEVMGNVLNNACGHAAGSITVAVSCGTAAGGAAAGDGGDGSAGDRMLVVAIEDDGPGFTPEALHRGCDPFYSDRKSAEHFGLGLNVSQILVQLHGGKIELGNAPDGGARVTATFDVGAFS